MGFSEGCLEAASVGKFSQSSQSTVPPEQRPPPPPPPGTDVHMGCGNKGFTSPAKCLCPARAGKPPSSLALLAQLPCLLRQLELVFAKALSPSLIMCLWFCDAGLEERGLGQRWTWPVGCPAVWPSLLFLGLALSVRMLQVSVTCCDVTWPNLSFKMVCDSSLFLRGCITLEVLQ